MHCSGYSSDSMTPQKAYPSIYHGTFVYCATPTTLSIKRGYLCVSSEGVIRALIVENELPQDSLGALAHQLGWDLEMVRLFEANDDEFFFPGFIGRFCSLKQKCCREGIDLVACVQ